MPVGEEGLLWLVAPLAGAWIEISERRRQTVPIIVAPLAGAWIEICRVRQNARYPASLPSRERGLKFNLKTNISQRVTVAPLAGAWIEIYNLYY